MAAKKSKTVGAKSDGMSQLRHKGDGLAERLDSLNSRLDRHKAEKEKAKYARSRGDSAGMALAFRLSSEFIAAIVVGAAFGYAMDQLFGFTPWGMIVFLMLGFAAAILNVMRASGMVAESGMRLHKVLDQDEKSSKDTNAH